MVDSIVTVVLKSTVGWLFSRGRNLAVKRLRSNGDLFNHRLSKLIESDFGAIKNELEAQKRKDLLHSISLFHEGIVIMKSQNVANANETVDGPTKPAKVGRFDSVDSSAAEVGVPTEKVDVTFSNYEMNQNARKRFENASAEAGSAFANSALSPKDKILATGIRILATLLGTEDSAEALYLCIYYLEEIHAHVAKTFDTELKEVHKLSPENLKKSPEGRDIIWHVCRLNRYVFDVAQKIGGKKVISRLFIWPCVENSGTGNEEQEIDPLRDPRLDELFRKEGREYCSVVWSFGEKASQGKHELNLPSSIATNSEGWFLIVDNGEPKMFGSRGEYQKSLPIPHTEIQCHVVDGDIDENGNVYLLVSLTNDTQNSDVVQVFDKDGNAKLQDNFQLVGGNKYKDSKLAVNQNKVLILKRELINKELHSKIEIYETKIDKYQFIGHLGEDILVDAKDMVCGNYGRIFVLDKCETRPHKKCIRKFVELMANDSFVVDYNSATVAFHRASEHIVIASKNEEKLRLSIYTTGGEIQRTYSLNEARIVSNPSITVTTKGRIAVALVQEVVAGTQGKVIIY